MGETETLEIDRYGDVTLQVGGETPDSQDERVSFVVCSRTLARVSPVFDRMLFGLFAESARNKEPQAAWVVELPEDKPTAMEVFLNIAHCRFDRIPAILSTDELYDLTVLTNSYDATPLLGPWAQGWMDFVNDIANDASRAMPKMLWISWELGCRDALNATARRLILESRGPLVGGPDWEDDLQTPPDIIERIDAIRLQTISSLLGVVRDMTEQLVVVDERPRLCKHAEWKAPHRCESMMLESMIFCLTRASLWPLPDHHDVQLSVATLYEKLADLVIHDLGQIPERPLADHEGCNPRMYLLEQLRRVMDDVPDPLRDSHLKAVEEQVQKLRASAPSLAYKQQNSTRQPRIV